MLRPGQKLVIASHNAGKVEEIAALLAPLGLDICSAADFPQLHEPEENAPDFIGNALIKAHYVMQHTGCAALADDSGLVVPALDGAPGIYSARWAGPEKDFNLAMLKVKTALQERDVDPEGQKAHFVCALALCQAECSDITVEGYAHGHLSFPPRGTKGFGYDPIFIPQGQAHSFAEIDPEAKQALSHRQDAFSKLLLAL